MKNNTYIVVIKAINPDADGVKETVSRVQNKCEADTPISAIIKLLKSVTPEWDKYYTALTTATELNISCELIETNED